MRFESWRGAFSKMAWCAAVGLGLGLAGLATSASADGYRFTHTIPRVVEAYDYTTGSQYQAPPIPYGHYAKDPAGALSKLAGCAGCRMHALLGCLGCGHENGLGLGHGHGDGSGSGCGPFGCDGEGGGLGHGHGLGLGSGLFGHGHGGGNGCVVPGCGGGAGCGHQAAGRFAPIDCGNAIAGPVAATAQSPGAGTAVVMPSSLGSCGDPGCNVGGRHSHGLGKWGRGGGCGLCGGRGCGACLGGLHNGGPGGGNGCRFCGGQGCANCLSKLAGLHGRLADMHGRLAGMLHPQKVDYFVGPGGPVPLTPGYVPYIVTTRSPRDFFSFAPMNPNDR